MNMKKFIAGITAAATISAFAVSANAADWSLASYADNDPATVNIISTDADGVTFTQGTPGGSCKARLTLINMLENPEDVSKIKSGSWDVTYTGLSALSGTEIGWMGGGTYCATCNSAGFGLAPNDTDEDGKPIWEDTQTVQDSFKWLLPSQVPTDAAEAEFVFMDWSGQDLVELGITVRISNFKLFDADGNEIAQKAYSGSDAAAPAEPAPEAPAADAESTPAPTGNTPAAAVAAVMAVAGAAALISRRK